MVLNKVIQEEIDKWMEVGDCMTVSLQGTSKL